MYKYGMRLRGFSIGCQPMIGLVRRENDPTGRYHDILIYSRPLNYYNKVRAGRHFHPETEELLVKLLEIIRDDGLEVFHSICRERYPLFTYYDGFIP